jgi:hypothetical protein
MCKCIEADTIGIEKSRENLNHVLRNSTVKIEGCLKEIETILIFMRASIKEFVETLKNGREE